MSAKHSGLCPFCANVVTPVVVTENYIRRDVCKCPECSEKVLVCRSPGCTNYAKAGYLYDDELCPSCTSSIVSGAGEVLKWGLMAAAAAVATVATGKVGSRD